MYFLNNDTITALATPPGIGAIALIRLSGKDSFKIVDSVFKSKNKNFDLFKCESHTMHFGTIEDNSVLIDEVVILLYRSPHSFTGEDSIEITCHGSVYIQQKLISLLIKKGARLAMPGEFTMRAFLNRRMDLSQAEAVADLIASDSKASHELAMKQMRGGFSNEIKKLRKELIDFASLIELELDFSEEDVEFANRNELKKSLDKLMTIIADLITSFDLGNVIRKGIPVVIAGRPNAGKSTLLNALLNEDRAIVSETPGTTRDTIEEEVVLDGVKFRFIDTAGLRETHDAIEKLGVSKAYEKMNESPVILYLFDALVTNGKDLREQLNKLKSNITENVRIIPVGNKIDVTSHYNLDVGYSQIPDLFFISAKENTNIDKLRSFLISLYTKGKINPNNAIVSNARHASVLQKIYESLVEANTGLTMGKTNDFIAADLRLALNYLGEITGEVSTEDLLENIFGRFCIGK